MFFPELEMKKFFPFLLDRYRNMNIAVKASLWFAFCSILQRGISVLTMPIFTRIMPTGEYGQYNIFQTWYNILFIIVTLNIQSEIFNKGLIEHDENKDEFAANQAGLLIVLAVVFSGLYLIFRNWVNLALGLPTSLVLVMIVEILGTAVIGLWSARKRFDFDYGKIVILTVVNSLLTPTIGILAVLNSNDKAQARLVANALVPAVAAFFLLIFIRRGGRFFRHTDWWKSSFLLSLPLIPHYLSLVLLNQSDKLMIKYFMNVEYAAIYSVAHAAGLLMTIVNTSINGSFVPWAYYKMKKGQEKDIAKVGTSLCGLVMLANVLLIWFAPEAIRLLAAPQYAEAIWCLVPIAASVFFFFVYTLFVDIEIYFGCNKYIAFSSVCSALLNIVLNYVFIPIYGYIAAGYTTLASYFVTMVLHYVFMRIVLRRHAYACPIYDLRFIIIYSLLLIVLCSIAMILYDFTVIRISMAVAVLAVFVFFRDKVTALFREMKSRND